MRASECPPEKMPSARYPCENQACVQQGTWRAEELRWSPGSGDGQGTAWLPGFYCGTCHGEATHSGATGNTPTLAEEMARRTGVVGERSDAANVVKLQLVGTLVCFPFEMPQDALLEVTLADEGGEHHWTWHLSVGFDWPETECLPCDLVSVEGHLAADGECDPFLAVSRVRLLRRDITGEQRKRLLECEDAVERWDRAQRLSYSQSRASS